MDNRENSNTITSKALLNNWLHYETNRYGIRRMDRIRQIFELTESDVIRKFQRRLRTTEYYFNTHKRIRYFISKCFLVRLQTKYCLHIPINTCGKGLKIMHLGPILINERAHLGENCVLHINTAIVAGGTNDYVPSLGNNVIVGIGSTILGNVHIANYVAIGANSVVNKDVLEENIAVAGIPAKKISNNGALEWNKTAKK